MYAKVPRALEDIIQLCVAGTLLQHLQVQQCVLEHVQKILPAGTADTVAMLEAHSSPKGGNQVLDLIRITWYNL